MFQWEVLGLKHVVSRHFDVELLVACVSWIERF